LHFHFTPFLFYQSRRISYILFGFVYSWFTNYALRKAVYGQFTSLIKDLPDASWKHAKWATFCSGFETAEPRGFEHSDFVEFDQHMLSVNRAESWKKTLAGHAMASPPPNWITQHDRMFRRRIKWGHDNRTTSGDTSISHT
jgi:hypothetical protein